MKEAFKYSVENEIMSQNQFLMSLKRNIYSSLMRIPKAYHIQMNFGLLI